MSPVMRKTVMGVSNQARHKSTFIATLDRQKLDISDFETTGR